MFQSKPKKGEDSVEAKTAWKPLTSGIKIEKYSKRKKNVDAAEPRSIDIDTSNNLQFLSVIKPEGSIKLEPLELLPVQCSVPD